MNTTLHPAARCYLALVNGTIAAFFAVLHFPHNRVKNFKKGHRLVVLPEYQGLGIGHELSSRVAAMWVRKGYRFIITSNTKALYEQRKKDRRWVISRIGRIEGHRGPTNSTGLKRSESANRITISYEFIGTDEKKGT